YLESAIDSIATSYSTVLLPAPLPSTLFPYTTLFRSGRKQEGRKQEDCGPQGAGPQGRRQEGSSPQAGRQKGVGEEGDRQEGRSEDRKSTRLNSSHVKISYAVFCLKKKSISYISKSSI